MSLTSSYIRVIFLSTVLLGCSNRGTNTISVISDETDNGQLIGILLSCLELSENTLLSTKNDEIALYLHAGDSLSTPLLNEFLFYQGQMVSDSIPLFHSGNGNDFLVLVIELDTEWDEQELFSTLKQNSEQLVSAHKRRDLTSIRSFIGDNDLLGAGYYSEKQLLSGVDFKGIHLFDEFHYVLKGYQK